MLKPDDRIWACTGTTVLSFLYDEWAWVWKCAHFLLHCDFPPLSKSSIFWSMYAFRFLSLTSRRRLDSDSDDVGEVQKAFHFRTPKWVTIFFFGFGYNGLDSSWLISLYSILLSLQLSWRLAPEKLGLCQVICISPCLKREMTVQSTELNSASVEKKKKEEKPVLPIGERSMIHGPLLATGLGEPFSFFSERTKLFCLKLLVLLTRYEDVLNDMVISVPSELKHILNKWCFLATLYFSHTL